MGLELAQKCNFNVSSLSRNGIYADGAIKKGNNFVGNVQANAVAHVALNICSAVE